MSRNKGFPRWSHGMKWNTHKSSINETTDCLDGSGLRGKSESDTEMTNRIAGKGGCGDLKVSGTVTSEVGLIVNIFATCRNRSSYCDDLLAAI